MTRKVGGVETTALGIQLKCQSRHLSDRLKNVLPSRPLIRKPQTFDPGERCAGFRRVFAIDILRPHGITGLGILERVAHFHFHGH